MPLRKCSVLHFVIICRRVLSVCVKCLCHTLTVGRFVKYTGYGNAAGLLAQRGLMCGGHGAVYSSESEDSETEEYEKLKDRSVVCIFCHTLLHDPFGFSEF